MKKLFLFMAMMLSMTVQADNVLYAVVSEDDSSIVLKCGNSVPENTGTGPYFYDILKSSYSPAGNATSFTVDISCQNYTGTTLRGLFSNFVYLKTINGLSYLNTSHVTDMSMMFSGCSALTSIDLSSFNTANVTDMSMMFTDCFALTSLDLSKFNTANVTNMKWMFMWCSSLTSLDLSMFDTANVTDMSGMFGSCSALTSLNLSGWNTTNVTNVALMFGNCTALTSLDLSSFNTAKVTDMYGMFSYCSSLTTIYGSNWDTEKVTDGGSVMFDNCTNLVGGAGSAYEFYHGNDKTYARIDGGPDAPGYFTDKTTAAIKGISMGMAAGEAITYNLNGQRVAQPTKGLFIVNGKKVVIK